MNHRISFFLLISLTLIISCTTDENIEAEENNYRNGLPYYFIQNGNYYFKYEWNEQDKINSYLEYDGPEETPSEYYFENNYMTANIYFSYDSLGRISYSQSAGECSVLNRFSNYYYTDDRLDSIISHQYNWEHFYYYLTYDSNHNCGPLESNYFYKSNNDSIRELRRQYWDYGNDCFAFNYREENYNYELNSLELGDEYQFRYTFDTELNEWPIRRIACNFNSLDYTYPLSMNVVSKDLYSTEGEFIRNIYSSELEYFPNNRLKLEIRTSSTGIKDTFEFFYR